MYFELASLYIINVFTSVEEKTSKGIEERQTIFSKGRIEIEESSNIRTNKKTQKVVSTSNGAIDCVINHINVPKPGITGSIYIRLNNFKPEIKDFPLKYICSCFDVNYPCH